MNVPRIISKNNHEFIFVKECNKNIFLYKDMLYGYTECFTKFDLGMVKEIVPARKTHLKPERIKVK